jgi:plastocyanin
LDKIVIIPRLNNLRKNQEGSYIKYFNPRFIKIRIGQTITWVNRENDSHELVSGNAEHGRPDGILNTGIIESCKSVSKKFDINTTSIPYFCLRHPEERGAIVIYSKHEEEKMTMKEGIDHLRQVFEFNNNKQQQRDNRIYISKVRRPCD